MYTVGQLGKKTGISIRALHYYEKLGLLHPIRSDSGYRLYGENSIIQLQQITILKKMRFTLTEISEILGQTGSDDNTASLIEVWERALEQQVSIVNQQKESLQTVEHLLQSAQYAIRATGQVNISELLNFIREIETCPSPDKSRRERFFTAEEQMNLPTNAFDNPLIMEWADILRDIQKHINEPPTSAASQQLAAQIDNYARQLFMGDEQLLETYWNYIIPDEDQSSIMYGMTREVIRYIESILEVFHGSDVSL
ncbi:MerR family transcriptional regulator [Paenibacillus sp. Marseille-Q7038]